MRKQIFEVKVGYPLVTIHYYDDHTYQWDSDTYKWKLVDGCLHSDNEWDGPDGTKMRDEVQEAYQAYVASLVLEEPCSL